MSAEATEVLSTSEDLISTTAAAREVLKSGWWLFSCPPRSKKPAKDSHAHLDARSDESAMEPWSSGIAANPAIALEQSGLTVLDIDTGLWSVEQALDFAERILCVKTMVVKSNRGFHFYFTGSREVNAKYSNGNVQGDLKSNGYVLAAGAIHPDSGKVYEVLNPGVSPAPLPDKLLKYSAEKKSKDKKVAQVVVPTIERGQPEYTQPEYSDKKVWKGSRYEYLRRKACHYRKDGGEVDGIEAMLRNLCVNRCEDGEAYIRLYGDKIHELALLACGLTMSRIRRVASPKPMPGWWKSLVDMLTVNTPVQWSVIKATVHGVDKTNRSTLVYARKALNITTYMLHGVRYWERKESPKTDVNLPPELGKVNNTPLTPSATEHTSLNMVNTEHGQQSRKTYLREAKRKSRAKAKQSQGGAQ